MTFYVLWNSDSHQDDQGMILEDCMQWGARLWNPGSNPLS